MAFEIYNVITWDSAEPVTRSITITEGNQIGILMLGTSDARDNAITATFDGVSMIRPSDSPQVTSAGEEATTDWVYINLSGKPAGTYNMNYQVVSGGPDGARFAFFIVKGIDPANPINVSGGTVGSSGNNSINLTTTNSECLLLDFFYHDAGTDRTAGANQVVLFQDAIGGYTTRMGASYKTTTSPATYNMTWTGNSDAWAVVALALNPELRGGSFLYHLI
jgi:hypothetical protein